MKFGASLSYLSSGSRINYTDFSGYFNFDQLVNRVSLAGTSRVFLKPDNKFSYRPEMNIILSFLNLSFQTDLNLYNSSRNTNDLKFSSKGLQLRLNWLLTRRVLYMINLDVCRIKFPSLEGVGVGFIRKVSFLESQTIPIGLINRFNFSQRFYIINQVVYELDIYSGRLIFSQNSDAHFLNARNDSTRLD
jgi:hypothetical protein